MAADIVDEEYALDASVVLQGKGAVLLLACGVPHCIAHRLTLKPYLPAAHLLDDLFDLDADGEEVARFEGVVGVAVDQAALAYAGLAQQQQLYRAARRLARDLRRH